VKKKKKKIGEDEHNNNNKNANGGKGERARGWVKLSNHHETRNNPSPATKPLPSSHLGRLVDSDLFVLQTQGKDHRASASVEVCESCRRLRQNLKTMMM
jgi:hypothetical protein